MNKYANQLGTVKTNVPWMLKEYCDFTAYKLHLLHALQIGDKFKIPNFAACILHDFSTEHSFLLTLFGVRPFFTSLAMSIGTSGHKVLSNYIFFFSEGFM
jgi:hypothetical protein